VRLNVLRKKAPVLAIGWLVTSVILGGMLSGCSKYSNRNVRGAVLAMPASGDVGVRDLLITNWAPGESSEEFFVTYTTSLPVAWWWFNFLISLNRRWWRYWILKLAR
jgi:hypothetical protein